MASVAEMFQFVANFGPMLGQLASDLDHLRDRVERLENGGAGVGAAAPDASDAPGPDEGGVIEMFGQKIDLGEMLKGQMPEGGPASFFKMAGNWKPKPKEPAPAPTPPAAPPASPEAPKP